MTEDKKKEIIEGVVKQAVDAQIRFDTCAWSTLYGLSTYFKFIPQEMVAASRALSGGVASSGCSCGALCSGALALGAKYYPTVEEDLNDAPDAPQKRDLAFSKIFRLRDAFMAEYGSLLCSGVQKCIYGRSFNLLDDKERDEFLNLPGHEEQCAKVVATAVRLTAELLLEDE